MQDVFIEDFTTEEEGERNYFLKPISKRLMLERIKRANMNWFTELGLPLSATNPATIEFDKQFNNGYNLIRKPNRKQHNVTFAKQLVHYSDNLVLKRQTIDTLANSNNQQTNVTVAISELKSSILLAYHKNPDDTESLLSSDISTTSGGEPEFANYEDANCHDANSNDEIVEEIIDDIMDGIESDNCIGDYIGQQQQVANDNCPDVIIPLIQMHETTLETIDETDNEMDVQIESDFIAKENRSTFHYKYEGEDIENDTTSHHSDDDDDEDDEDDNDDDNDDDNGDNDVRDNGDQVNVNAKSDYSHVVATSYIRKENCGNYITEEGGPIREATNNCYHQIHLESFGDGRAAIGIAGEQTKTIPVQSLNNARGDLMQKNKLLNNMINDRKQPAIKAIESSSATAAASSLSTTPETFLPMLKLSSKACCQHKRNQQKLPKYTGYFSEYGLSHEQLVAREKRLQRRRRSIVEQTMKTTEQEIRRMHENERAFTKWLQNKMRYPVNTTRNMFDVKRPLGQHKFNNNKVNRLSKANE